MPSSYLKFAVDFDGNGRRDLIHSAPDALASTANYLSAYGWQRGGAWAGEIGQTQFLPSSYLKYAVDYDGNGRRDLIHSVPDVLASTANYLKGYGWQRGQPWDEGTANFQVLLQWNASQVYTKTVAYFAQQLAGGQ